MIRSLHGLVLAGGQSRRMGRDKAALQVNGRTALERTVAMLAPHCETVFVSVRAGDDDDLRARYPQINDRHGGVGPADGIASALAHAPEAAWLVVACDLPRLSSAALQALIAGRDPRADATAFRSGRDELPEPLCAIYEPRSRALIEEHLARDKRCPRKMLLTMNTRLLPPADDDALANANTPDDWISIVGHRA